MHILSCIITWHVTNNYCTNVKNIHKLNTIISYNKILIFIVEIGKKINKKRSILFVKAYP